jgi:hypothetical protein
MNKIENAAPETSLEMTADEAAKLGNEASHQIKEIFGSLEKDYPGITEGIATAVGAGVGGTGSFFALSALGTAGLSAPGITSGLAAAGSLVGGGMVAGIGVLAAPIALLGVGGYAIAKKRRTAKRLAILHEAIARLYDIQKTLLGNAEYFEKQIAEISMAIDLLTQKADTGVLPKKAIADGQ